MIENRYTQKPAQTAQERPQQPESAQAINIPSEAQNVQKRLLKPFTALDGSNYRPMYRAVCDFHEQHNPPRLDGDNGESYWRKVLVDMSKTAERFGNDPFMLGMLASVFEELERQFKLLREEDLNRLHDT